MGENILRQFQLDLAANSVAYRPNHPALHFSLNDPIGSRQNWRQSLKLSRNNRRTAIIFIRFLAYFPEANPSSTSLSSMFWKYSKTFHQQPEKIQRLFRLQNCLSRKSSAPGIIQRLFRLPNCLSRKSSAPGNIQRLFRLQNCLSRKSSVPGKIQRLFRLQNVLAANHQLYPSNIQRPSG